MKTLTVLLCGLLLTGCVGPMAWSKPGASYNERVAAWETCDRASTAQLYGQAAPAAAGVADVVPTPVGTELGNAAGAASGAVDAIGTAVVMERQRHTHFVACMEAAGFTNR